MAGTGCQGPYVNGDNGSSDCPCWGCKCCPPPCCGSVTINYDCVSKCGYLTAEDGTPLIAESGLCSILFGEAMTETTYSVSVTATPGDSGGICCIEFIGGGSSFRAVGNGTVDASLSGSAGGLCGELTVYINDEEGPVSVSDGDTFSVTVESENPDCCPCTKTTATNPCGTSMRMATLGRNNKIMLNRRLLVQRAQAARMKRGMILK